MKAGKIKNYCIMIQSAWIVLSISIQTLFKVYFHCTQEAVDELAREMSRRLLKAINLDYAIDDPNHLNLDPNRQYIVMCNHASHYDIPLSFLAIPGSLRMIAKKELFKVPIWGRAMKKAGFLSVDREESSDAKKILTEAKEKMKHNVAIWIAPEGTRSKTGQLQPFKKGGFMLAYQTDAIIIPIGIRGSFKLLPPKTFDFHTHEHAEVHIGKPIDTLNYKIRDRAQLMKDVEQSIRELACL